MGSNTRKMTFAVTQEIEVQLESCKKKFFANQNTSEMIRELLLAGIRSLDEQTSSNHISENSV